MSMRQRTTSVAALLAAILWMALPLTPATANEVITLQGNWRGQGVESATYDRSSAVFTGAGMEFRYGRPGDVPLVGDWDGDGLTELGINRGKWMHLKTVLGPGEGDISYWYGWETDTAITGDWNYDGIDTVSVVRDGAVYVKNSHTGGEADYIRPDSSPTPEERVRGVLAAHGCEDVTFSFRAGMNTAGVAHWTAVPQRIEFNAAYGPMLEHTAAHECAHMVTYDVFVQRYPSRTESYIHDTLNGITGETGTMGAEIIADCLMARWGYQPAYVFNPAYCDQFATTVDNLLSNRLPTPLG